MTLFLDDDWLVGESPHVVHTFSNRVICPLSTVHTSQRREVRVLWTPLVPIKGQHENILFSFGLEIILLKLLQYHHQLLSVCSLLVPASSKCRE